MAQEAESKPEVMSGYNPQELPPVNCVYSQMSKPVILENTFHIHIQSPAWSTEKTNTGIGEE